MGSEFVVEWDEATLVYISLTGENRAVKSRQVRRCLSKHNSECFSHHFAGAAVLAGFDEIADFLLEFWGQADVHADFSQFNANTSIAINVKD